jgi:hypothetical protein
MVWHRVASEVFPSTSNSEIIISTPFFEHGFCVRCDFFHALLIYYSYGLVQLELKWDYVNLYAPTNLTQKLILIGKTCYLVYISTSPSCVGSLKP